MSEQSLLAQVNIYPIKSIAGISLSSAWVEKQGLCFDRRFMIALPDGGMVTARKYPKMVKVAASLLPDGMILTYPDMPDLRLRYSDFEMAEVSTQVWNDRFAAFSTTDAANKWFQSILGIDVQLLFTGEQSNRVREKIGHNVSFADGYPLLIIGQGSLDELNRRSSDFHVMEQFRTNLVAATSEPFEEDTWKRIRIGQVEFESVKPCERCILTTVDTQKGDFRASKEPLKTLSEFRANERGGVFFGQNLVAKNEGMIQAGDTIEILEYKEPEFYPDNSTQALNLTCVDRQWIAKDFATFWFEPKQGDLPNFKPGQHLPIEVMINGEKHSRYYSLSSSPFHPSRYAISVKRVEDGRVSNWMLDNLQIGDVLQADTPTGDFHLSQSQTPLLLMSAGSGITPMLSMLRYLVDNDELTDVVFYHQCSSIEDIPVKEELEKLNDLYPQLQLMISISGKSTTWKGLSGRLTLSHLKKIPNLAERQVFVCGPQGFMDKANNLMSKLGLPDNQYHQEAFATEVVATEPEKAVSITVNGATFIGNNQQPLLVQAEEQGVDIPYTCRAGLCGACKVTVKQGEVIQPDMPALLPSDKQENIALACCCIPSDNLEVEF
ncbi:hybrid-cluster NAD(P)-dependent oxidoreductase [Vibrio sp. SCSIO 43136]|uniref:hybrid-cluster NAD(P)-dependent oxidoreductase n=1 Tax=Vibrio sp. SCSIO 43136 TaxID=2819101 RepID=UPI0020759149|nr:hybrid-cluster NAD(P)-dependent oxidoreductase [Vibrio sp. SCSIO 43136]USD68073.1 hybrid-cluster NAD(P)-dependent oxidoreductase [Vibrio sp. SCSIO 43136]